MGSICSDRKSIHIHPSGYAGKNPDVQLHGRSRQQRYSKLANWAYIKQCVETLHAASDDAGLPRVPMFGNGDCYSAQQYWEAKEESGVDGVLVARGALIKPWIFTEIKERREWDISASERLDIVKQVCRALSL
jgi:tRNA-dihydrouridine synthase 3